MVTGSTEGEHRKPFAVFRIPLFHHTMYLRLPLGRSVRQSNKSSVNLTADKLLETMR
jgi:hypothetical protein